VEQPALEFLRKGVGVHIDSVMLRFPVTHVAGQVDTVVSFVGRHYCSRQKEKAARLVM
jgi:hypothetical protein